MAHTSTMVLAGIQGRHGWRLWKNLLGGLLIVLVWLSLWAWMAVGVVRPLSAMAGATGAASARSAPGLRIWSAP